MVERDACGIPRRTILRSSAAVATLGLSQCSVRQPDPGSDQPSSVDPADASVDQLRAGLESGAWTTESLCETFLGRIEALDRSGPGLNSIIEVNPEASLLAEQLDAERSAGRVRSPLHGVPVMLKDNIDTADAMQTTAGSLALVDAGVREDSWVAARLRVAGALLIAKTNLSEWANFRSRNSTSGWSARGGLTLNPYALDRNPCGSSSGSGVAVSAKLTPLAIGTETNGSITCPSSINGIVGIKPTVGLVGRSGIVPIAHTQDTAGPMARSVADAAALLGALTGSDPGDPATDASSDISLDDYTVHLDPSALQGAQIGVIRRYWGLMDEMDAILDDSVAALNDSGATVHEIDELPGVRNSNGPGFELMLYEFKADLNRYLSSLGPDAKVRSLDDVIRFNQDHSGEELRHFGQEIMEAASLKGDLTEPAYQTALRQSRDVCRAAIDETMASRSLDALFAPSTGPAWLTDLERGDRGMFPSCSSAPARAGYPHITVPGGFVSGLPVGVSFFGRAWSEPKLIGLAHAFEQATQIRRDPGMPPTAQFGSA